MSEEKVSLTEWKYPSIVREVMSSPAITLDANTLVRDAAILMSEKKIGSLIIVRHGVPVEIVTKRDLVEKIISTCKDPCQVKVEEVMSTPLISVLVSEGLLSVMRKMRDLGISQLGVKDGKKLVGVISERDAVRAVTYSALSSFSTLRPRR